MEALIAQSTRRRRRHWRQRFDPDVQMVFRRPMRLAVNGRVEQFSVGDPVPESIGLKKMRSWWNAHRIELADYTPPPRGELADPPDRILQIKEAIGRMDAENASLWTNSGKPKIDVLAEMLGWRPTGAERDEAWAAYIAENGNGR